MISIFVKTSYKLDESINLSSAMQIALNSYRLENEKYRNNEFDYAYDAFVNPRLGINWNISPTIFFYSQLSVTNREPQMTSFYDAADAVGLGYWPDIQPQFDTTATGEFDFSSPLIQPEKVTDFEIGFGTLNSNVMIQANLFYMKFNNELFISELLYGYAPKYDNIDESLHYGLEVNAALQLNQNMKMKLNFSLNESEILVYSDNDALEGKKIAGFPRVIINEGIEYRIKDFTLNGTVKYIGKQFTSNDNIEELSVDPYSNIDIGLYYDAKNIYPGLQFNFHINNVSNDLYATYGTGSKYASQYINIYKQYLSNNAGGHS
jgi:iron complex outermembrane receptor protein